MLDIIYMTKRPDEATQTERDRPALETQIAELISYYLGAYDARDQFDELDEPGWADVAGNVEFSRWLAARIVALLMKSSSTR